jgi:hypothetical protein
MKEISSEIEIAAPAERVWHVLSTFAAYPQWNPFIRQVDGRAKTDSALALKFRLPDGKATSLKARVTKVDANRELCWLGGISPLLTAEHHFTIEPLDSQRCRFAQRETFSGLLLPLFSGRIAQTERGFAEMDKALKARAEKQG